MVHFGEFDNNTTYCCTHSTLTINCIVNLLWLYSQYINYIVVNVLWLYYMNWTCYASSFAEFSEVYCESIESESKQTRWFECSSLFLGCSVPCELQQFIENRLLMHIFIVILMFMKIVEYILVFNVGYTFVLILNK